jgi:hypothetical protein
MDCTGDSACLVGMAIVVGMGLTSICKGLDVVTGPRRTPSLAGGLLPISKEASYGPPALPRA